MALMFLHIPRTGGSSVWHSLAHVATRQDKLLGDLYHQSRQMTGDPFAPEQALQHIHQQLQEAGRCFADEVIYHHHTDQHVPYLLASEQVQRVALVRDPTARLVSEAFHMRRFLRGEQAKVHAGEQPDGEYELHRQWYGEALFEAMTAPDVDPDSLVLMFARHHQYYYLRYFSRFLLPDLDTPVFDEAFARHLAHEARQAFIWVGDFAQLADFVSMCALLADLDLDIEQDLLHIANGSAVPQLAPATLAHVRKISTLDYVFLQALLPAYDAHLAERLIALKRARDGRHEAALRARDADLDAAAKASSEERIALEEVRAELDNQRIALLHAEEQLRIDQAALQMRAQALRECQDRVRALHASTSWRVTAPLRWLGGRLKR